MAASVERRAACGASYNACASGATPCKFETRQPARPAGKLRRTVNFNAELGAGNARDNKCRDRYQPACPEPMVCCEDEGQLRAAARVHRFVMDVELAGPEGIG